METESKYNYSAEYYFQVENMDNEKYITDRLDALKLTGVERQAFENILRFLYINNYNRNTANKTNKKYMNYLTVVEKSLLNRLQTLSSGTQRYNYGTNAVLAIKRDKYRCAVCKERDVRCLEMDHVNGRTGEKGNKDQYYTIDDFQTLCANHHRIKTIVEKQQN